MESCKRLVHLRKIHQEVSNMAVGLRLILTRFMVRSWKNSWNLQIFFWAEKHLRFLHTTGQDMKIGGQVLMKSQNT
jgi:hypothetical protein